MKSTRSRSQLRRSPGRTLGRAGLVLLAVPALAAALAPLVARHSPTRPSGLPLRRPSLGHPLGTDDLGVDIFAQLVYGARISLAIGLGAAALALVIGLLVAVVAGWKRGWAEAVLMRLTDVTLAFPFLPLVLVLAAFFGRGLITTAVVIAAVSWARPARVLWAQVLKLREYQHVQAARAMGGSGIRIVSRHIVRRLAPLSSAQFVRVANAAVISEAALAFLGLGDPNQASWGMMLANASSNNAMLTGAWKWWMMPAGLALTVVVLGFAFTGYACEEWADPRLSSSAGRLRFLTGRRRPVAAATAVEAVDGPILAVDDLVVSYEKGGPRAVDEVSFEVRRGRITALVGESGSGKSTIVMALLGLLPGDPVVTGDATFEGRKLLTAAAAARVRGRKIGLVTQAAMNALNPAYTVHAQVAEAAELTMSPLKARARATELLEEVGLPASTHRAYPHELSGGMRQRVIIAMALANSPDLLIADEPTTGLDLVTQASILRLLQDLKDRMGLTVLVITHDVQMVLRVADELVILQNGRVVERGAAARVAAAPAQEYSRRLLNTRLSPLGVRA
jgi:ABC-type dipeptide/oligopeptide/nickel transport system ATPase component/ABC-type dipeptide/oligopeptide/nickel transport system permease subunit